MTPRLLVVAATLSFWVFTAILFAAAALVMEGRLFAWAPAWLASLALSGTVACLSLAALREALRGRGRFFRWTALAFVTPTLAFVQAVADFQFLMWIRRLYDHAVSPNIISAIGFNFLVYLWLFALYVAALDLVAARRRAERQERRLLEAQAASDQARLDALRYQINPHFLFNTLNGLLTLISTHRNGEAAEMVRRLTTLLRTTLVAQGEDDTTLAAELDILEAYLEVDQVRFGSRLEVEIDCPTQLRNVRVPTLILHPLVENVMTHVVGAATQPVRLEIVCRAEGDDLLLHVVNTGQASTTPAPGLGIGLSNVSARLNLLYGERGRLETAPRADGHRASIRQPLIQAG